VTYPQFWVTPYAPQPRKRSVAAILTVIHGGLSVPASLLVVADVDNLDTVVGRPGRHWRQ